MVRMESEHEDREIDAQILKILDPDEVIQARAVALNAEIAVTDRRIVVSEYQRVALNVAIDAIRRIQFDVERNRPASLVIVPESPRDTPQVLAIPNRELQAACAALTLIGSRLD